MTGQMDRRLTTIRTELDERLASRRHVRTSNFLYVDGHVESKQVKETLDPFQWGERFYSLEN